MKKAISTIERAIHKDMTLTQNHQIDDFYKVQTRKIDVVKRSEHAAPCNR